MTLKSLVLCSALAASAQGKVYFQEKFEDATWRDRWVDSTWKDAKEMSPFTLSAGSVFGDEDAQKGLMCAESHRFYSTTSKFPESFSSKDKELVIQFSAKRAVKGGCGGAYIKVLGAEGLDQDKFGGESPYNIMFGPDVCGSTSRIHAIFNYDGENLLKTDDIPMAQKDDKTHVYTLHVKPDNTFAVFVDHELKESGDLVDNWAFPQKQIDDSDDKKPEDWVDGAMIPDENDVKPEGYDDIQEKIVDPEATKPEDWDDEDDGVWEAPMISNPEFKGPWEQKFIPNPAYKGEWSPKKIDNPKFDSSMYSYNDFGAVGLDLWVVDEGTVFDNIFIGDDIEEAKAFFEETFTPYKEAEEAAFKVKKEKEDEERKLEAAKREAEQDAEEAIAKAKLEAEGEGEDLDAEAEAEERDEL